MSTQVAWAIQSTGSYPSPLSSTVNNVRIERSIVLDFITLLNISTTIRSSVRCSHHYATLSYFTQNHISCPIHKYVEMPNKFSRSASSEGATVAHVD